MPSPVLSVLSYTVTFTGLPVVVGTGGSPAPSPYHHSAGWDMKKLGIVDTLTSEGSLHLLAPFACKEQEESSAHIFAHCPTTRKSVSHYSLFSV